MLDYIWVNTGVRILGSLENIQVENTPCRKEHVVVHELIY